MLRLCAAVTRVRVRPDLRLHRRLGSVPHSFQLFTTKIQLYNWLAGHMEMVPDRASQLTRFPAASTVACPAALSPTATSDPDLRPSHGQTTTHSAPLEASADKWEWLGEPQAPSQSPEQQQQEYALARRGPEKTHALRVKAHSKAPRFEDIVSQLEQLQGAGYRGVYNTGSNICLNTAIDLAAKSLQSAHQALNLASIHPPGSPENTQALNCAEAHITKAIRRTNLAVKIAAEVKRLERNRAAAVAQGLQILQERQQQQAAVIEDDGEEVTSCFYPGLA